VTASLDLNLIFDVEASDTGSDVLSHSASDVSRPTEAENFLINDVHVLGLRNGTHPVSASAITGTEGSRLQTI